jgi:hypothetical protein
MSNREKLPALLENLLPMVKNLLGDRPDFEAVWQSAVDQYLTWFNEYAEKVTWLTCNLALLENLSHAFIYDLRGDKDITDLILAEAPAPGQEFIISDSPGLEITCLVTDRQITPVFLCCCSWKMTPEK